MRSIISFTFLVLEQGIDNNSILRVDAEKLEAIMSKIMVKMSILIGHCQICYVVAILVSSYSLSMR